MLCKNCGKEIMWLEAATNTYPKKYNLLDDHHPAHWAHVDTGAGMCNTFYATPKKTWKKTRRGEKRLPAWNESAILEEI